MTRLATETGAGQWGSALAFAGAVFGLEVKVYMVRASYDQKPYRRILMETYGAQVVRQPVASTPSTAARSSPRPRTTPGSLGHRHQRGDRGHRHPSRDEVLARLGVRLRPAPPDGHRPGGDRADGDGRRGAGRHHRLRRRRLELRRADLPVARPDVPRRQEVPGHRRRAGGRAEPDPRRLRLRLRRHGPDDAARQDAHPRRTTSSPSRSTPAACATTACRRSCQPAQGAGLDRGPEPSTSAATFAAGVQFARAEGILPAPEPTHAIKVAIDEALDGQGGGRGAGDPVQPVRPRPLRPGGLRAATSTARLEDYEYPREKVEAALASLPKV